MRTLAIGAVCVSLAMSSSGQELGRGSLSAEGGAAQGLTRTPLPAARYDGFLRGGMWGVKAGLGWASVDWDVGAASGTETLFAPQASLFYKATDHVDVNVSTLIISAEDEDDLLGDTVFLNAEVTHNVLLGSSEVIINGESEELDVTATCLNLGVTWMF